MSTTNTLYFPFVTNLSDAAAEIISNPSSNEITGLDLISNCIDLTSTAGQALQAVIIEAQNATQLSNNGLNGSQPFAANPIPLSTPPTGTNTIGGGLIS